MRLTLLLGSAALTLAGCSGKKDDAAPAVISPRAARPDAPAATAAAPPVAVPPTEPTPATPPVEATPAAVAAPLEGHDFIHEARILYRVVACSGEAPIPAHLDSKVVAAHCAKMATKVEEYRSRYVAEARAFFANLIPSGIPDKVVYPFGGGDLISSLVAFPDALETTTISLELSGDPRRIATLARAEQASSLAGLRGDFGGMLDVGSNTSENLRSSQRNQLPAQLSSFLVGLAVNGFEPVAVRYFRIEAGGDLDYLDDAEIAAIEGKQEQAAADEASAQETGKKKGKRAKAAKARKGSWVQPNFSEAFANVEIRYRKMGDPGAAEHVHRHVAWNLANDAMVAQPELLQHLEQKGRVTGLVKGASYLLWNDGFSTIRDYLLAHLDWMLSDSTGIPPAYATKAGMVQEPLGRFTGSYLKAAERHNRDFRALWKKNPVRKLPFRFGYVDASKQAHLLITRPKQAGE